MFRDGNLLSNFPFERKYSLRNTVQRWLFFTAKRLAKRVLPKTMRKVLRKHREKHREFYGFQNHPFQWYGIHDSSYILRQLKKGATSINSILVIDYIKHIKNDINENFIIFKKF